MNKISKKLNQVIIIEGNKEELLKYMEEIRRRDIPLISVQFPKNRERISTSYINSNWKTNKNRVDDVVFFAKSANNQYVFAFNNEKFAHRFKRTFEKMHLDAQYQYIRPASDKVVIVKDIYEKGQLVDSKTTAEFSMTKYSVAKCFA